MVDLVVPQNRTVAGVCVGNREASVVGPLNQPVIVNRRQLRSVLAVEARRSGRSLTFFHKHFLCAFLFTEAPKHPCTPKSTEHVVLKTRTSLPIGVF